MATLSGVFRCFYVSGISLALHPRQNGPSTAQEPRKVRKEGGVTEGAGIASQPALEFRSHGWALQQGNPTQEGKMGLFGAPLAFFRLAFWS